MRGVLVAVVALACACSGGKVPPPDGAKCPGNMHSPVYDLCNTEHDCTSSICQLFAAASLQVCTQACSATVPCPIDTTGAAGTCTTMGVCQPAQANPCTP